MRNELNSIRKGYTWRDLFLALWHIATVRYATPKQLRISFPQDTWRIKCGTEGKLDQFVSKGLLKRSDKGVFAVTPKTIKFLKQELVFWKEDLIVKGKFDQYEWNTIKKKYNPDILWLGDGKGAKESLYNSDILLQAIKRPDFFALFYHIFNNLKGRPFLIPDGIILLTENNKARLVFLEIEKKKPDWLGHISNKQKKYEKIAQDKTIWATWWRNQCELLQIQHCSIDEFGFSVWCIGEVEPTNWQGWEFKKDLST